MWCRLLRLERKGKEKKGKVRYVHTDLPPRSCKAAAAMDIRQCDSTLFIITGLQAVAFYLFESMTKWVAWQARLLVPNALGHHIVEVLGVVMLMGTDKALVAMNALLHRSSMFHCTVAQAIHLACWAQDTSSAWKVLLLSCISSAQRLAESRACLQCDSVLMATR